MSDLDAATIKELADQLAKRAGRSVDPTVLRHDIEVAAKVYLEFVRDKDIVGVRAGFIDGDSKPFPKKWHVSPAIVCRRTLDRWHAYWLVDGLTPEQFEEVQKRLALHYGTDKSVSNASRVMRLPGYLHQKNKARPTAYCLENSVDA